MPHNFGSKHTFTWLRACYFFFFAILGLLVPYLGVFFESRGFNPQQIGFLLAIVLGTRIIAPNVWARVADKTGYRTELIKLGAIGAAISFVSFFYHGSILYLALSLVIYTFFWNSILAQLEVVTLESLGENAHQYGKIRSWGSVGYIVLVIAAGAAIDRYGAEILPSLGMGLFLLLALCTLPLPKANVDEAQKRAITPLKLSASVSLFLLSALLMQMSVGPFYGFFVLYLKQVGYSETLAGVLVALGVLAEIGIFIKAPWLIQKFGLKLLLIISTALTALRWLILAWYPQNLSLVCLSQVLHAFTFGLTHAVSIQFIYQQFPKGHRSRGQALYASISFGVGGALGTWLAGIIWGDGSSSALVWVFAAICAIISALVVLAINMDKPHQHELTQSHAST
ncbi:MFS transporter [Shewanella sp. WXL01]|uniref:MFS transporter n=1 Tax=Shewanella sp. WXL01 TaxID=2709721 RepID=UPI001438361C|nr:MFS transporter [Shewanella sp. WXL01]NKF51155.1 MFS transporter [Shewanella sp. WXL01]